MIFDTLNPQEIWREILQICPPHLSTAASLPGEIHVLVHMGSTWTCASGVDAAACQITLAAMCSAGSDVGGAACGAGWCGDGERCSVVVGRCVAPPAAEKHPYLRDERR